MKSDHKYKILLILFCLFLCSCAGKTEKSKLDSITDPQEYVNELAAQGYTSIYNSYVFKKTDKNSTVWTAPFAGIKSFRLPSAMTKAKGIIAASGGSETIPGSGLVTADVVYFPMTAAEYDELIKNISLAAFYAQTDAGMLQKYKQLAGTYSAAAKPLFSVYGVKNNGSADDLKNLIKDIYVTYGNYDETIALIAASSLTVYPAGNAEDFSFYIVQNGTPKEADFASEETAPYFEEYRTIFSEAGKYGSSFSFHRPLALTEVNLDGQSIRFATADISGNAVKSEDFFKPYKFTMLNIWSTTCSVCLTEIPVLQKMSEKYNADGVQIAGLLYDGDDPAAAKEAAEFLKEYGITYTNIVANDELKNIFPTQSFPMTYYFDSEGKMIGDPVIGANIEKYEQKIIEYLEKK